MWIPAKVVDLLGYVKEDLTALRAENTLLRAQLTTAQGNFDWARHRLNTLEFENKALLEKVSGIRVPSPEIARAPKPLDPGIDPRNFDFNDMGDQLAIKLGLPTYGDTKSN